MADQARLVRSGEEACQMVLRTLHAIFDCFLQDRFECTLFTSLSSNISDVTLTIIRNNAKHTEQSNLVVIFSSLCMYAAFPFVGDLEVRGSAGTGHALNASSLGTIPSLNYLLNCRVPRYPKTVKTWEE